MLVTMLKSKVHRLTVTDADLEYEGSFTLDAELMEAARLLPFERVDVLNVTNGARLSTYLIPGPAGSRVAIANGAAAHHVRPGDVVIVASYADMTEVEARAHVPTIVLVDERNEPRQPRAPKATAGASAG